MEHVRSSFGTKRDDGLEDIGQRFTTPDLLEDRNLLLLQTFDSLCSPDAHLILMCQDEIGNSVTLLVKGAGQLGRFLVYNDGVSLTE